MLTLLNDHVRQNYYTVDWYAFIIFIEENINRINPKRLYTTLRATHLLITHLY